MGANIYLVILFLGFVIGVGVTILLYSSITWKRIKGHWNLVEGVLYSDPLLSFLAFNASANIFAYEMICDGKSSEAADILSGQIASIVRFASDRKIVSPSFVLTLSTFKTVCDKHPELRLKVDQAFKAYDLGGLESAIGVQGKP